MTKKVKLRSLSKVPTAGEPVWNPEKDENQLFELLNWYSYNKDRDDAEKYFLEYLKKTNHSERFIENVSSLPAQSISKSIGWACRILLLSEHTLPPNIKFKVIEEIKKIEILIEKKKIKKSVHKIESKEGPNIQERLKNQLTEYFSEIEYQIDFFLENNLKNEFDFQDFFSKKDIKFGPAKNIAEQYENGLLKELKLALKLTIKPEKIKTLDDQLVEGYSFLGAPGLKKFISFIEKIIKEANVRYEISKQISNDNKKLRIKKPKPAGKQVEKLKYLKEYENLKSIIPSSIVGSTQLWIYNTKYRVLGVYVCDNPHGFSVKGSTILNFNQIESISKKLRKPEEVIPKVLESGKVALRKLLETVRSKEKQLTGRINKDTILLRAL